MNPMFGISVSVEFSAAHHINGYEGDCARPHGHNFKVVVEAVTPRLNSIGIAVDFKDLKKMIKELVDRYDHQDLNLIPPFTDINPTAETLSRFFFDELSGNISKISSLNGLELRKVSVYENERSAASYGLF